MRTTVRRLRSCLGELPHIEARVLALRAGIGPGHALSVSQTAQRLHRGPRAVRRIERRALREIRRAARDGCTASAAPDGSGPDAAAVVAGSADTALADAAGSLPAAQGESGATSAGETQSGPSTSAPRSGVKGEHRSKSEPLRFPGVLMPGAPSVGVPLPLVLFPVLVTAACIGMGLVRRRRRLQRMRAY